MEKRLPGLLVNSYGFANFTFTLMMLLALNYYSIFLTDVAMITPANVSVIMLISNLVDAFSVIVSGSIIQKSNMRWGRFRSWLLFIPIFTCIFFTLSFTNMPLSYVYKLVYLAFAYTIAHVSLNFAFNAHLGLISVLSTGVNERLRLSARNIQLGYGSNILFSIAVIPMLVFFSKRSPTWGYFHTVLILAILQILGYWNIFFQTKDYEKQDPDLKLNPSGNPSLWDMIKQVGGNPPLLLIMIADTVVNLGIFSLSTLAVYYFKYVTGNQLWMSPYTLFLGFAVLASALIGPFVATRIGKKNTYIYSGIYGTIGFIFLRIFGASNPYIYVAIICISVLGSGVSAPIRQAMYMDTAEYGYYKTGKDASAFVISMFTLPVKIGIALAMTLATAGLAYIGYVPNMAVTPQFVNNLMDVICYIPAACGIIAFAVMVFYPLTDEKLAMYMEANKIKRAEAVEAKA